MIKFVNGKSNKMFQQAVIHYTFCLPILYNGYGNSVYKPHPNQFFFPAARTGMAHSFDLYPGIPLAVTF